MFNIFFKCEGKQYKRIDGKRLVILNNFSHEKENFK